MAHIRSALILYVLPVAAVAVIAYGYAQSAHGKSTNTLCEHQFALCTSARCVPTPGDPTKAICFCDVEEGKSMSTVPCETIKPSTDKNGVRTVCSTFALQQFTQGKLGMKRPSGTPKTWCHNKICTVDLRPQEGHLHL